MATFRIPNSQKQIRQVNRGDIYGELWSSFNIDSVSQVGKIKVSPKLLKILESGDDISGTVQAFVVYANDALVATNSRRYYLFTDSSAYTCDITADPTDSSNWTQRLALNDVDSYTDATVYAGYIVYSRGTDITRHNGSGQVIDDWWSNTISGTALTDGYPHMLHVHLGGQETLLVTDGNLVRYYNSTAGHTTLTLQNTLVANCITSGIDTLWVGTYSIGTNNAYVYKFGIGDTIPQTAYQIDGQAVMSITTVNNTPYIVTDKGTIQAFNGAGFKTVAEFPFIDKSTAFSGIQPGVFTSGSSAPVHPKGMQTSNEIIYINLDSSTSDITPAAPIDERCPSGIWTFNTQTNSLSHHAAPAEDANSYGNVRANESGPILMVENQYTRYLVGSGATNDGLYGESSQTPQAYFITPELTSETIQEAYERIILKAATMASGERMLLKYRTEKKQDYPHYANITWIDGTRFNTTDATLGTADVGDEVEVIAGAVAGTMAHITEKSASTSEYTITLDESIGSANNTSTVRLQNWRKVDKEYDSTYGELFQTSVTKTGGWVQFKVLMTGDIEARQFISKGNAKSEL